VFPLGRHQAVLTARETPEADMGDASHVAAILLLFGAATADAQVAPPPPAAGAYQKLTPGNQKVARALFEAQTVPMTTTTTKAGKTAAQSPAPAPSASSANGRKPLTLDQISAMKQNGTGWDYVFRQMRAQGLLTEKNIGQVMAHHGQSRLPSASVVTTGAPGPSSDNSADSYGRSGNLR
jgi:hypothetical protein